MNNTKRCVFFAGVALGAIASTATASTVAYTVVAENVLDFHSGSLAGATTAAITFYVDSAAIDNDPSAANGAFATTGDINIFINGAAFTSLAGGTGFLKLTDNLTNDSVNFNYTTGGGDPSIRFAGALPTTDAYNGGPLPTTLPMMDFSNNFVTFFTSLDITLPGGLLSFFKVTDFYIGEFVPNSVAVPLPAPAAMGLFGLALVGARRRR